ncbi:MAG: ATP phosphoribosyltransferase regulatory subunit, partial [Clostridia bacterium]|nr:ATP phosphoribosyltransferase regulatory subunit [Clostridia bacterium]
LDDFQIELGNVGFFKGLLDAYKVQDDDRDILVNCIESKNGIKLYSLSGEMDKKMLDTLARLPMLFGGEEILQEAQAMCLNAQMQEAVDNLKAVYAGIKSMGYEKYVTFDMSSVGKMKYYSGMVMRGIIKNLGRPILSGGRYDKLCDAFGKNIPAVGFAIAIGYLTRALDNQQSLFKAPEVQVVVGYVPSKMSLAESKVNELLSKGINAKCTFATTKEDLAKVKDMLKAKRGIFLGDKEEEV